MLEVSYKISKEGRIAVNPTTLRKRGKAMKKVYRSDGTQAPQNLKGRDEDRGSHSKKEKVHLEGLGS